MPGVDVTSGLQLSPLDSDGDGVADTLVNDPPGVARSDGTVTFESAGNTVSFNYPVSAGDLDGDHRDEILLFVNTTSDDVEQWVVPGTVSPGTHDVSAVGIRINGPAKVASPVQDRTGDGITDLMVSTFEGSAIDPTTQTTITSGAAIMAVGAGGDARSITPVLSMPGFFVAFAQLSPGPSSLITVKWSSDAAEFRIGHDSSAPVFTTAPAPRHVGAAGASVRVGDEGTYMIGGTGGRTGGESYLWRLDQPCGPLPPLPPRPPQPSPRPPSPDSPRLAMPS